MTRLLWQHTQSRARSDNDKTYLSNPHEWFSRTYSESSRQALTDLVKAHKRKQSGSSNGAKSRLRGSTVSSNEWQEPAPAGSGSEDNGSRPTTPQHAREGFIYSNFDRSEGGTRALIAKGSQMLRRSGSRISLSSTGSSSTMGLTTPPRSRSSSAFASNVPLRGDDIRKAISAPFDFQHITHTEQSQFTGLDRIEESELAQQFSSITTERPARFELVGIEVSNLPANVISHHCATIPEGSLRTPEPTSTSILIPSCPLPPPKEDSATLTGSQRSSTQSTSHNAALPNPSSPQLLRLALTSDTELSLFSADVVSSLARESMEASITVNGTASNLDTKPLPEIPVIHAVTTEDDSARAMKAAPLPTLPGMPLFGLEGETMQGRPLHQRQQSSLTLRHMSFYPTAKVSMPNLLAGNCLSASGRGLPRYHSDMALSEQARNSSTMSSTRVSMSFGVIDTMNWEDAVDEAWDDVGELDEPVDFEQQHAASPRNKSEFTAHLQPVTADDAIYTPSTPLMMAPPWRTSNIEGTEVHQLQCVKEDGDDLTGLGVSACPASGTTLNLTPLLRSSSLHLPRRQGSVGYPVAGNLTRSSSQESIILSIASSIVGTQRSSRSSVSAADLSSINRIQEDLDRNAHLYQDPAYEEVHHVARPESGCLPFDITKHLSMVETAPNAFEDEEDEVPAMQPLPLHQHSNSISKVTVPERRSSVAACEPSRLGRQRSDATQAGTRPRQSSRVSYSLFPATQPVPLSTVVST